MPSTAVDQARQWRLTGEQALSRQPSTAGQKKRKLEPPSFWKRRAQCSAPMVAKDLTDNLVGTAVDDTSDGTTSSGDEEGPIRTRALLARWRRRWREL